MSTKVDIRSIESYKPSTEVSNTFSKQKKLPNENLVKPGRSWSSVDQSINWSLNILILHVQIKIQRLRFNKNG